MPINFTCPNCQFQSVVADQYVGQTGPCAGCGQMITIPGESTGNPFSAPIKDPNTNANPYHAPAQTIVGAENERPDLGMRMLIPVDRSALSIIAGYCGLFSVLCFPAPIALVLGILAIVDIKKSNGKKHGLGRAWFAVIMGVLFMIIPLVSLIFM